jgi:hypothetical protein
MRIGISGVSSTGKSTLASDLALATNLPLLSDVDLHAETFKRLEQQGLMPHTRVFPEMTTEEHVTVERCMIRTRIQMEADAKDFVADETPLDFLNYLYNVCGPRPDLMPPDEFDLIRRAMLDLLTRYDFIFYLPFDQLPVVNDNRRFTNKNLLQLWDFSLRGIHEKYRLICRLPLHTMAYSDRRARLDHAFNIVNGITEL